MVNDIMVKRHRNNKQIQKSWKRVKFESEKFRFWPKELQDSKLKVNSRILSILANSL